MEDSRLVHNALQRTSNRIIKACDSSGHIAALLVQIEEKDVPGMINLLQSGIDLESKRSRPTPIELPSTNCLPSLRYKTWRHCRQRGCRECRCGRAGWGRSSR